MSTKMIGLAAAIAGLALAPAIALGSPARTAANSTVYPDSVGEDALAPDITSTTVSNDDTGLITFHIAISNRPALTDDMLIAIILDSDHNPATGDTQGVLGLAGSDYLIQLAPGEVNLFKWNGTDYMFTSAASLVYSYDATGAVIRIKATDLGTPKTLGFAIIALSGIVVDPATGNSDLTNAHRDLSPDPGHGSFTYNVLIKVTLSVVAYTTSPKPVKSGKPFSVGLALNESDTNGPVTRARITCVARIAGKRVQVRSNRLLNGVAVCVWSVPKTAKGKRIQGSIAVVAQAVTVTRTFSLKVT